MTDKFQQNGAPDGRDDDAQPMISVIKKDYILQARGISFSHWKTVRDSYGNPFSKVRVFEPNRNSRALVVRKASESITTREWWRAFNNPESYTGTVTQQAPCDGTAVKVPGIIKRNILIGEEKAIAIMTWNLMVG